ncbi:hypothetical protein Tco_0065000 [Tanacetum coccineum]
MWRLRIEQYFQVQDYARWNVIENGNSFKPIPQTITNADGTSTTLIPGPVTTEEKVQKKNDVKARNLVASEYFKSAGYLRNKPDLDTMSFDDLYNNFKIVEQEIKGTASLSVVSDEVIIALGTCCFLACSILISRMSSMLFGGSNMWSESHPNLGWF